MRRLGEEGSIVRYLAQHTGIQRPVEVHVLRDGLDMASAAADHLLRAARAAGGATHRNLQGVVDTGRDEDERPYVVYEALQGRNLDALIEEKPTGLDTARAARLISQVLEAMRSLHDAGVVLRTLRPEHVMVREVSVDEELVKIRSVYGAALKAEGAAEPVPPVGRTRYLAPELTGGAVPGVDPRVDFYSVGMMLRTLLAGTKPPGQPLTDAARRAVFRACATDPEERFANADGFLQAVSLLLGGPGQDLPALESAAEDPLQADLKYLSLRQRTRKPPPTPPGQESRLLLLPVLLTIEAIYRHYGDHIWSEVCRSVPEADGLLPGAGNTEANVARGVAVGLFARIVLEVDRLAGSGDLGLLPKIGESVAKRGLEVLLPTLPTPVTVDSFVDSFPALWNRLSKDGHPTVRRLSPGSIRLSVTGQPTPSLELAGFTAGLLREGMRRAGARHAEVVLISSAALGDSEDRYGAEWV
ncbi:MAG: protein kinase [Sandaracinaceae bacterium]